VVVCGDRNLGSVDGEEEDIPDHSGGRGVDDAVPR